MRDDRWLLSRLNDIWDNYFTNVSQDNPIVIKFGRYSKYRLGSIRLNPSNKFSLITITAMFKSEEIPAEVIDHTIAHEMVHYTHGFSSGKRRMHRYPHAGGVVKREMEERGMGHLHLAYRKWVKTYRNILREE